MANESDTPVVPPPWFAGRRVPVLLYRINRRPARVRSLFAGDAEQPESFGTHLRQCLLWGFEYRTEGHGSERFWQLGNESVTADGRCLMGMIGFRTPGVIEDDYFDSESRSWRTAAVSTETHAAAPFAIVFASRYLAIARHGVHGHQRRPHLATSEDFLMAMDSLSDSSHESASGRRPQLVPPAASRSHRRVLPSELEPTTAKPGRQSEVRFAGGGVLPPGAFGLTWLHCIGPVVWGVTATVAGAAPTSAVADARWVADACVPSAAGSAPVASAAATREVDAADGQATAQTPLCAVGELTKGSAESAQSQRSCPWLRLREQAW